MLTIAELVEPEALKKLVTPANLRLGNEILSQTGVRLESVDPFRVSAKVGGVPAADQRRTVELTAGGNGLQWSCTCSSRRNLFCKHCAAVALTVRSAPLVPDI